MSIAYLTAAKNNRLSVALLGSTVTPSAGQSVDGGSGNGKLVIGTTGMATTLVTITLAKPSFSVASGVATLLGVPLSGTASASGTAASAQLQDSAGNIIGSGLTVGTSGADVNITGTTTITSGQTVTVTSGTITAT
jgi:hypothetical protein